MSFWGKVFIVVVIAAFLGGFSVRCTLFSYDHPGLLLEFK